MDKWDLWPKSRGKYQLLIVSDSWQPRGLYPHQAPLFMGFSKQEYCKNSGLPFPPPGDLPDPGIKVGSPKLKADCLLSKPPGKGRTGQRMKNYKRKNQGQDRILVKST